MRSQGISQFYLHTQRSSANRMNHTCLCLPSQRWYSFTDPIWMEGWVGLGQSSFFKAFCCSVMFDVHFYLVWKHACEKWSMCTVRINLRFGVILWIDDAPNYYPNSFSGPEAQTAKLDSVFSVSGNVARYNTADDDNFTQVGTFWRKVWQYSTFQSSSSSSSSSSPLLSRNF